MRTREMGQHRIHVLVLAAHGFEQIGVQAFRSLVEHRGIDVLDLGDVMQPRQHGNIHPGLFVGVDELLAEFGGFLC